MNDSFFDNWDFGEKVKNKELESIINKHILKIIKKLKKLTIEQSTQKEDMEECIDYKALFTISFRARRIDYGTYKKRGGDITLRKTGRNGGKAETYKMINGESKSKIYVFVWKCGSYLIVHIPTWIKSGIIQKKLKGNDIQNINKNNRFIAFTLKELQKINCVICFYNAKQKNILEYF